MKDLIMAISYGYTYSQLGVFIRSLARTSFRGDLVLFVGETDRASMRLLRKDGIWLIPFWYPYRRCHKLRTPFHRLWPLVRPLLSQLDSVGTIQQIAAPFLNLSILRFAFYRNFLLRHGGGYKRIFLTDLRDVCFQSDPFLRADDGGLRVFLEEPGHTLGGCPNNSRWLMELYGPDVLGDLAANPIICSGTILGDRERLVAYLNAFLFSLPRARSVMRMGMDQGIHNYLVYRGLVGPVVFCQNRESEVLTMGLMNPADLPQRSGNGLFVDVNGDPYPVLHQFDRHEGIRREILSAYN